MTERDRKFEYDDKAYFKYIEQLDQLHEGAKDIVFNFPLYVGTVNLARYLGMYEMYKQVIDVAGHVADVGTYRGASFVFFAKMIKLLEPYSSTHVHGFDWFKGMAPQGDDNQAYSGQYKGDYERLLKHIELQDLSGFAHVHKMNIVEELAGFLEKNPSLRFKLVFLDCGIKDVLSASMQHFWPRMVKGGILVLDHYNSPYSPFESEIVDKFCGGLPVRQIPFSRSPSGYIIKE